LDRHVTSPANFWRGRAVLLTGHTGFKGAWLCHWLQTLGAKVTGFSLPPSTAPSLWSLLQLDAAAPPGRRDGIPRDGVLRDDVLPVRSVIGDLRDAALVTAAVSAADPQVVFHLAAQALVRESYRDPLATYATNVMGTALLLDALRPLRRLQCAVIVTSDKVYANDGEGRPFTEGDRLGGHDPYSNSKACAELVAASYRESFFAGRAPIATARAGNVIGGGDWSPDRLIPDCVRALSANEPVALRYPDAVRPWQHVFEPLSGYLAFAQALVETPDTTPRALNFGPDPTAFRTVRDVVAGFGASFGGKPGWTPAAGPSPPEARALTLASTLAQSRLRWRPCLDFDTSLAWTAQWYRAYAAGEDMAAVSGAQLSQYRNLESTHP
jgi:CDP-glucose 4,6-dehydratase